MTLQFIYATGFLFAAMLGMHLFAWLAELYGADKISLPVFLLGVVAISILCGVLVWRAMAITR